MIFCGLFSLPTAEVDDAASLFAARLATVHGHGGARPNFIALALALALALGFALV